MEFTLEDTLEVLKDTQAERQREIDDLMNIILNNNPVALNNASNPEDVRKKQQNFYRSLLYHVSREEDNDLPIVRTPDMHIQVLSELEEEVEASQKLLDYMKAELSEINEDISCLESKQQGLEKMKEAYAVTAETKAGTTYMKEQVITHRMFKEVKSDLSAVVDVIFPKNPEFKYFLADLVLSYSKGGNELYVDVTPDVLYFVNFLIGANIAVYHRNDKNKVRLTEPL
nr:uncharacterized protein LOC117606493 [Osmia lignaria]